MSNTITKELCGHSFQLGTSIERRSLLPKYRILSLILFHTILNKKGHLNELTLYVLHIMFHMAHRRKINLPALICHNMIEARRSNVSTHALPYGSTLCLLLQNARLDFKTLPYESIPRMQPMRMKMSIDKQTTSSSSCKSTKSSQLGDIYAMCKSMNNQLKIIPLQHGKHCTLMLYLIRHHRQMTRKMVMMMVEMKKTKMHRLMERSNLSFWSSYN